MLLAGDALHSHRHLCAPAAKALASPAKGSPPGGDPWPRQFAYQGAKISVYQPQLSDWTGNRLDAYSAVLIRTGADKTDFGLFREHNPLVQLNGLVLSPQVFAETNITGWLKLRTGLTYSFYSFEDQSLIKKTDLNNIALTFGFILGKFK